MSRLANSTLFVDWENYAYNMQTVKMKINYSSSYAYKAHSSQCPNQIQGVL